MSQGIPLTDSDRQPWLAALHQQILGFLELNQPAVLACPALKASYRQVLQVDPLNVVFVNLKGSPELLRARLAGRKDHYLKPGMLQSQLDDLEEPLDALQVDIALCQEEIIHIILEKLDLVAPG